jgi:type I restriction enzyme S subunit
MSDRNKNKPGYKETKAGWMPSDWQCRTLDSIATRLTGHTPDNNVPEYWNGGVKWVSLADSDRLDRGLILSTDKEISDLGIKHSSARRLPYGTVVLLRDASVGKVGILAQEMAVSQHFVAWVCGGELENRYLYYWLLSQRRLFVRVAVGTTIVTIGMPFFAKLTVPVPPLPEQIEIADILTTCDEVIEKTSALINSKKQQKKTLMHQLLTGKKRLPRFEGEWTKVVLANLCTRLKEVAENPDGYPVLSITARTGFVSQEDKFSRVIAGKQVENYVVLKRGDFAYNKGNSYLYPQGCVYQLSEYDEGLVPNVFYSFRLDEACADADFIKQYFLAGLHNKDLYRWINSGVRNNGLLNLNASDFFKLPISLPPLPEQKAIGNVFREADTEIRALDAKLKSLKQQKKALMQKLLTGQVRVKV